MKTKKKNRFLTFCCSCLPGAGEMYMGFMKTGVSLMALFFGSIFAATMLNIGPLMFITAIIWFFGFFHANHLAGLEDSAFAAVPDEYLFGAAFWEEQKLSVDKHRKAVAIALIVIGIYFCWNTILGMCLGWTNDWISRVLWDINDMIPRVAISAAIIIIGLRMINGKKEELKKDEMKENSTTETIYIPEQKAENVNETAETVVEQDNSAE